MQNMNDASYQQLIKDVGKDMADNVVNALDKQGKSLEKLGTAFKMPMKAADDDEDEDEEDDDNPFPPKKSTDLTTAELLSFSSIKALDKTTQALHGEVDKMRKVQKDTNNQIGQFRDKIGGIEDSLRRIEEHFAQLTTRQPASKSPATEYMGGYPPADASYDKNQKGQESPEPIFNQMQKNRGIIMPLTQQAEQAEQANSDNPNE